MYTRIMKAYIYIYIYMETIELIADIRFQPKKIILLKLWQSLRVHQNINYGYFMKFLAQILTLLHD